MTEKPEVSPEEIIPPHEAELVSFLDRVAGVWPPRLAYQEILVAIGEWEDFEEIRKEVPPNITYHMFVSMQGSRTWIFERLGMVLEVTVARYGLDPVIIHKASRLCVETHDALVLELSDLIEDPCLDCPRRAESDCVDASFCYNEAKISPIMRDRIEMSYGLSCFLDIVRWPAEDVVKAMADAGYVNEDPEGTMLAAEHELLRLRRIVEARIDEPVHHPGSANSGPVSDMHTASAGEKGQSSMETQKESRCLPMTKAEIARRLMGPNTRAERITAVLKAHGLKRFPGSKTKYTIRLDKFDPNTIRRLMGK